MVRYKQKCSLCKKEWALVSSQRQRVICNTCALPLLRAPIDDPELAKLFAIDPSLYEKSTFLRDIRLFYALYKGLSEKQRAAFSKVVQDLTHSVVPEKNAKNVTLVKRKIKTKIEKKKRKKIISSS